MAPCRKIHGNWWFMTSNANKEANPLKYTQGRLSIVVAVVSLVSLAASSAVAAERVCRSTLGAVTVDAIRVPTGATCTLNGTFVRGNVKVDPNATLVANDVLVIGDVQGDAARNVAVSNESRISGPCRLNLAAARRLRIAA